MLIARALLEEAAEARDPGFAIGRRRPQHAVGEAGLAQNGDLHPVELLAAEIRRIDRTRIDNDGVDAGFPQHRSRDRAREPRADDGDIRLLHRCGRVHDGYLRMPAR